MNCYPSLVGVGFEVLELVPRKYLVGTFSEKSRLD